MQKITSNVYVETANHGCNTSFFVTREGIVMVDTPMVPAEAKKWRDEIAKHGQLRYVINGEPHGDHISGNCWFGGALIGHEGTRQAILAAKVEDIKGMLQRMMPEALPLDPEFKYRAPEITLSQRLTLHLGDHTFQLINLPGHTPYQLAVYVPEERVVCTSDNVIQGMPFLHQAVPYAWLESLKQLQQLDFDQIIPGHGNVCPRSYLKEMSETIQYWIDQVNSAIAKGWTKQEALEKVTLADKYPQATKDPRSDMTRRMGIDHLYDVLKK